MHTVMFAITLWAHVVKTSTVINAKFFIPAPPCVVDNCYIQTNMNYYCYLWQKTAVCVSFVNNSPYIPITQYVVEI